MFLCIHLPTSTLLTMTKHIILLVVRPAVSIQCAIKARLASTWKICVGDTATDHRLSATWSLFFCTTSHNHPQSSCCCCKMQTSECPNTFTKMFHMQWDRLHYFWYLSSQTFKTRQLDFMVIFCTTKNHYPIQTFYKIITMQCKNFWLSLGTFRFFNNDNIFHSNSIIS